MMKLLKELEWDDVWPVWLMHALCIGSVLVACFAVSCAIWFYTDHQTFTGRGEAIFVRVLCGCFYGVIGGLIMGTTSTTVTFAALYVKDFFARPRTRSELYRRFDGPLDDAEKSLSMARHYIQRVEGTNALKELETVDKTLTDIRKLVS